ncbi:hypothetical protein PCH_Pc22g13420 [Penicillium rubens Wisconsin 54-1255]|uniref:Uncharacterized protein n=1 Tax=Penicillium rubens (strain ATCC 28089 / DSM 1075 / NRRL 1951 / Wisconsin 54-1255) TaxID=500485 RepID=B6HT70_PENRW|nr:hypothetical protein PCH_Pc22g13420 [Penicillium rubens Wisconsin 54-1255]
MALMARIHASLWMPPSGIKGSSTNGATLWEKIFVAGGEKEKKGHPIALCRPAAPGYDRRSQHCKTGEQVEPPKTQSGSTSHSSELSCRLNLDVNKGPGGAEIKCKGGEPRQKERAINVSDDVSLRGFVSFPKVRAPIPIPLCSKIPRKGKIVELTCNPLLRNWYGVGRQGTRVERRSKAWILRTPYIKPGTGEPEALGGVLTPFNSVP